MLDSFLGWTTARRGKSKNNIEVPEKAKPAPEPIPDCPYTGGFEGWEQEWRTWNKEWRMHRKLGVTSFGIDHEGLCLCDEYDDVVCIPCSPESALKIANTIAEELGGWE